MTDTYTTLTLTLVLDGAPGHEHVIEAGRALAQVLEACADAEPRMMHAGTLKTTVRRAFDVQSYVDDGIEQ